MAKLALRPPDEAKGGQGDEYGVDPQKRIVKGGGKFQKELGMVADLLHPNRAALSFSERCPASRMQIRNLIELGKFKLSVYDHSDAAVISFHKLEWSANELEAATDGRVAPIRRCQQLYVVPLSCRNP